jgi:hypothetical protein
MDMEVAADSGVSDTAKEQDLQPLLVDRPNPPAGAHDNSTSDGISDPRPAGREEKVHADVTLTSLNPLAEAFVPEGSRLRLAFRSQAAMDDGRATYEEGPCRKKRTLYVELDDSTQMQEVDGEKLSGEKSRELLGRAFLL